MNRLATLLVLSAFSYNANAIDVTSLANGLLQSSSQSNADSERQNVVNRAIAEAAEDHDKALKFNEHAVKINQEVQIPSDGCNQLAISRNIKSSQEKKSETIRLIEQASAFSVMHTTNQPRITSEYIKLHREKFCSEEDSKRNGCEQAPAELQNADLNAASLFAPNESMTYSEAEDIAAQSYIHNLTNPFPTQAIPTSIENTVQGKAYVAAQMDEQRMLSLVNYSLSNVYASRRKPEVSELTVIGNEPRLGNLFGLLNGPDNNKIKMLTPTLTSAESQVNTTMEIQKQDAECKAAIQIAAVERESKIAEYIPRPAAETFSSGTCLDRIMETRINIFTMGSATGAIDRLLDQLINKACNIATAKWNSIISDVNQKAGTSISAPYVGTVFSTRVSSTSGQPTVNVVNAEQNQSFADRVFTSLGNLFK